MYQKSADKHQCRTIQRTPQYVSHALIRFPDLVYNRDKNDRLPIHYALENGMEWNNELVTMIVGNQQHLKDCDPVTKLPLLALAAMEPSCDLRTIYYLLSKNLECVDSAIEKHKRKNQSQECDNDDVLIQTPTQNRRGNHPRKKRKKEYNIRVGYSIMN